jgi:hypothetical protein
VGVFVNGRRGAAVLLLFAVLFVHGLQCSSGGDVATHDAADPVISLAMTAATGGHAASGHAEHATGGPSPEAMPSADHAPAGVVPSGERDSVPHGAGHLWVVCLAVLAAGLTALLRLLGVRWVPRAVHALAGTLRTALGSLPSARPPDLHALCLLRT